MFVNNINIQEFVKKPYQKGLVLFDIHSKRYVLKIDKKKNIEKEFENYALSTDKIQKIVSITPPRIIDLDEHFSCLLMNNYGLDYASSVRGELILKVSVEVMFEKLLSFLNKGFLWDGFVPRNIFLQSNNFSDIRIIDLENVLHFKDKVTQIPSLFLMKWSLGWDGYLEENLSANQIYNYIESSLQKNNISISTEAKIDELDSFEQCYQKIFLQLSPSKVREICTYTTLDSESSVFYEDSMLNFFDIGHAVEDLFCEEFPDNEMYLSVFFTYALEKIRSNTTRNELLKLHAFLKSYIDQRNIKKLIMFMIKSLNDNDANDIELPSKIPGFDEAVQRANTYESILLLCKNAVEKSLSILPSKCYVRGSLANGICSIYSDIDFEFSNEHSDLFNAEEVEKMICVLLSVLEIDSEGSTGRPTEADLYSKGLQQSRDLHEFMELRELGTKSIPQDIYNKFDLTELWWNEKSLYEKDGEKLSGKVAFFQSRSILSRYAFDNKITQSMYIPEILENISNLSDKILFKKNIQKALKSYESKDNELARSVASENYKLCKKFGYPIFNYTDIERL